MRRLLGRKAVTIIAAIISFTAIPGGAVVATATPAAAVTPVYICNVTGQDGCVAAPTLANGNPVTLTNAHGGRLINELWQGYTCCGGYKVYRLQFNALQSQCVAVGTSNNVTIRDCSGGNDSNASWAKVPLGSVWTWFNVTKQQYLTSNNQVGDQLFTANYGCSPACYQRWNN
jgi:hypothetical protein